MRALTIDPPVPFIVPELRHVTVALVGCGGTGSHIAQTLARLAAHCRDTNGPRVTLGLVDGDTVEAKNVGRQLFSAADVGKNKAKVLTARFAALFGIDIVAFPHYLKDQRIATEGSYGILVGAVDSAAGRRAIQNQLHRHGWRLWLDCGNHESSGQVVVGSVREAKDLVGAIQHGLCSRLPTAPALYPELLQDAAVQPRADCAAAMQDNAQSLQVNQMMAAIAGQYLYDLIVRRRLTRFRTVVDLETLTMRSDPITATALAEASGITADAVHGIKPKKARKKAA